MTTRAAEGLERRRWMVAEIEAMVHAGIIEESERFELIDGEVVPMSPKGIRHEIIKGSLMEFWMAHKSNTLRIMQETTFLLNASSFLEPNFLFFNSSIKLADLKSSNALLAVEIADTSLRYDLGRKATLYVAHGMREIWTIDAETLQAHMFSIPSPEGFLERKLVTSTEMLAPAFAPEIAVKMAELELV